MNYFFAIPSKIFSCSFLQVFFQSLPELFLGFLLEFVQRFLQEFFANFLQEFFCCSQSSTRSFLQSSTSSNLCDLFFCSFSRDLSKCFPGYFSQYFSRDFSRTFSWIFLKNISSGTPRCCSRDVSQELSGTSSQDFPAVFFWGFCRCFCRYVSLSSSHDFFQMFLQAFPYTGFCFFCQESPQILFFFMIFPRILPEFFLIFRRTLLGISHGISYEILWYEILGEISKGTLVIFCEKFW